MEERRTTEVTMHGGVVATLVVASGLLLAARLPDAALAEEGAVRKDVTVGTSVGEMHPDVRLPSVDGEGFLRLSDLRGRKVLLFHFASW